MMVRIVEGFRFAATDERLRPVLMLLALTALMAIPSGTLMPVFAKTILHGDARTLGWLMGAQGGGALVAGLVLTSRATGAKAHRVLSASCAMLGVMLVVFAISRTLWLSLAVSVMLGAATFTQVTAANTFIQAHTPDALRGRVMAIWVMILMGFAPVGSVVAGAAAAAVDPRLPLVVGGVACVLGSVGFSATQHQKFSATKHPR